MTTEQITAAIGSFAVDLMNSLDMRDKRNAVVFLARRVGLQKANAIAEVYGLTRDYYKVNTGDL